MSGVVIKRGLLLCLLFLLFWISLCRAETLRDDTHELETRHEHGVELARAGNYDAALTELSALLEKYPGYYPVERDIVIITAWKGDCRAALERYQRIRDYPDPEPYLILPVSNCLIRIGHFDEALALLDAGRRRAPEDSELLVAYADAQAKRAARLPDTLRLEASTDTSDQGRREWLLGALLSRQLTDRVQVYARYAATRSEYDEFQSGMLNRLGVGVQYEFRNNLFLTQEFSGDLVRGGESGSQTSVVFLPSDLWRFGASYTTFAEDLPLRAKADLIDAKRSNLFVDYRSTDYRWSWFASGTRYDFSDTNRRTALFTSVGYAYEMKPKREQRLFLELYQSDNTLANTDYFNPSHDRSITVVHKTDFVYDTRFRRHVDHLYLSVGQYDQEGFGGHGIWGVRYEQDYDFTERTALSLGVGYGRHVYDGGAEYEISVNAAYRYLF